MLTGASLGVTHPVLPCGAKVLLRFGGDTVLTEVIDNRLKSPGRQFELTEALARRLGLDGTQAGALALRLGRRTIDWPCSTLCVARAST